MSATERIREQLLLLKIRHGDAGAFAEVYDQYVEPLFRYILFRVPTEQVAEDLTSELFLRVWERLSGGQVVRNLRAYLYQVARNLVADHYRQVQPVLFDESATAEHQSARDSTIDRQLTLADLEQSLRQLKPDWQEVIILAHVEGFSLGQVAQIIGKTHGATRVLLHRALKELKRLINQ